MPDDDLYRVAFIGGGDRRDRYVLRPWVVVAGLALLLTNAVLLVLVLDDLGEILEILAGAGG